MKVGGVLFFKSVRRVVGCYYVNPTIVDCLADGLAIGRFLDGGVAFYQRSMGGVGGVVEVQVMNARFGGNAFFVNGTCVEKVELFGCSNMENMQSGVVAASQFHGEGGRTQAGFAGTDLGVGGEGDFTSEPSSKGFFVFENGPFENYLPVNQQLQCKDCSLFIA